MKRENKYSMQFGREAAGRHIRWAAGTLLCVILTGCGRADKALKLGEPLGLQDALAVQETTSLETEVTTEPAVVCVYVCGAVKNPGVVTLQEGSRYNDALEAAGGFAEDAAKEAVNLAKQISDGEQIFFPTIEEAQALSSSVWDEQSGLVNINSADVQKLCELPGIGESKAQSIVAYREQNGAFASIEDIMKVPGIKESAYRKIKDMITVR